MKTLIYGHRGASSEAPENTMAAFRLAYAQGAEGLELDVQMSKDGKLIVIHDETLERTTNGEGLVVHRTYDELRKLNATYTFKELQFEPLPILEDVLEWLASTSLELNIEMKNGVIPYANMEEEVIRLVREYELSERVVLSSFNHYSLVKAKRLDPRMRTAILYMAGLYQPWEYAKSIGADGLHPYYFSVVPEIVAGAHEAGVSVRPFTVDEPKDLRRLIQAGCDAVITNKPALMKTIREELG